MRRKFLGMLPVSYCQGCADHDGTILPIQSVGLLFYYFRTVVVWEHSHNIDERVEPVDTAEGTYVG
jgi:hypothetical protein